MIRALEEEALNREPLDENIAAKINKFCGVTAGMEAGQGSGVAAVTGKEAGQDSGAGGAVKYKYYESTFEALEYDSEEELSDEESINLSDQGVSR